MSGSLRGREIVMGLLNGTIDAAALDVLLSDPATYGAWLYLGQLATFQTVFNNATAGAVILASSLGLGGLLDANGATLAASDESTSQLFSNTDAAVTILTTPEYLAHWRDTPANYTRLKDQVNATGSVLIAENFTSSGTWSYPSGGIAALSLTGVGAGGGGGTSSLSGNTRGGHGGAGGEFATLQLTSGLPSADVTVTVSTSGDSSFGAFLIVEKGDGGGDAASPDNDGGGTTTNGGALAATDYESITDAPWQAVNQTQQGGDGGSARDTTVGDGRDGSVAFVAAGNVAGAGGDSTNSEGHEGEGLCSGGGSGGNEGSGRSGNTGQSASDYGCGGGGGGVGFNGTANGGSGGPALIRVCAVRNTPNS